MQQQQHHAPSASAIHWAATKGDLRTLRRLVEFEGVDPSAKDGSSHHCETPLFRAAGANHTEIIEYLVDYARVDVNQRDDSNHTALSWTCYFPDNVASVATLLAKGADPTIATHDGRTPLMIAAYAGYSDIAHLLLRHPRAADLLEARISPENEYHGGCTPLLLAAHAKRWETLAVLIEEGADPTVEDGAGRSVLQLAKEGGAPRRLVHRIEHVIGDAARSELLHKARTLSEASQALTKAVLQTYTMTAQPNPAPARSLSLPSGRRFSGQGQGLDKGTSPLSSLDERHASCLAAAPSFLKGRVSRGDSLPFPSVVTGVERPWEGVFLEERVKAVAAHVIAAPPLAEGQDGGMPQRAYKMLMAMLVPRFLERKDDARLKEVLAGMQAGRGARSRGSRGATRRGVSGSAAGLGSGLGVSTSTSVSGSWSGVGSPAEAAATVATEEDGVEESKGKGMMREEAADVKGGVGGLVKAASLGGGVGGVGVGGGGGVEELDAAIAKTMLNGLGGSGSGKGWAVRQLKAQAQQGSQQLQKQGSMQLQQLEREGSKLLQQGAQQLEKQGSKLLQHAPQQLQQQGSQLLQQGAQQLQQLGSKQLQQLGSSSRRGFFS